MKFSIITPTKNNADIISETVKSLEQQDYSKDLIEWILIDDESSDKTLDTIKLHNFHPAKWKLEENNGYFDALNKGIMMATGDVICFLPAGYALANRGSLYRISSAFNNSGAAFVYSNMDIGVWSDSKFKRIKTIYPGIYKRRRLKLGWCPPLSTIFINGDTLKSSLLSSDAFFDERFHDAAGIESIYRMIGRDKVEPAYLRITTVNGLVKKNKISGKNLWIALQAHNTGHFPAWLSLRHNF